MGTNYYAIRPKSAMELLRGETTADVVVHLGKKSCGWTFTLKVDPHTSVNTLSDVYRRYLSAKTTRIENEYGEIIELRDFINLVLLSRGLTVDYRHDSASSRRNLPYGRCDVEFS